ncbi:hypothetical protein T484DRAFT_1814163, partial [Baffinella frigidus]
MQEGLLPKLRATPSPAFAKIAIVSQGLLPKLRATPSPAFTKIAIVSQHRFYLAMENHLIDGYLTEKFFQGLISSTVMVYMGAPDASSLSPAPNSFIDASRFSSVKELAAYLKKVDADEELYQYHFRWRENLTRPED